MYSLFQSSFIQINIDQCSLPTFPERLETKIPRTEKPTDYFSVTRVEKLELDYS